MRELVMLLKNRPYSAAELKLLLNAKRVSHALTVLNRRGVIDFTINDLCTRVYYLTSLGHEQLLAGVWA